MRPVLRSLLATVVLATGCASRPAPPRGAPTIVRIDGSAGVMPLAAALAEAYRAAQPQVTIAMGAGMGTAERLDALASGRIDVALASHGIDEAELARRGLAAHEIARAAVVFATHAGVPLTAITQRQLCDVYAGRAVDWRALGGPSLAIAPRTRPAGEVDADVVLAGVPCLRDVAMAAHVRSIERPDAMAAALADTPGAIGMTSLPFVARSGGRLRALALDGVAPTAEQVRRGTYPLTRRSVFLTRAEPSPAVRAFLTFVRGPAGARTIAASGVVPADGAAVERR
ncbi:MAG: substrate-binding domain-containing protein [Gemmatirosa sp.]